MSHLWYGKLANQYLVFFLGFYRYERLFHDYIILPLQVRLEKTLHLTPLLVLGGISIKLSHEIGVLWICFICLNFLSF